MAASVNAAATKPVEEIARLLGIGEQEAAKFKAVQDAFIRNEQELGRLLALLGLGARGGVSDDDLRAIVSFAETVKDPEGLAKLANEALRLNEEVAGLEAANRGLAASVSDDEQGLAALVNAVDAAQANLRELEAQVREREGSGGTAQS